LIIRLTSQPSSKRFWFNRRSASGSLARLGQVDLGPLTCSRLAALAFLHDIGKANRGFRSRVDPGAPPIGHIDQLSWVFNGSGSRPNVATSSAWSA
jgi:hypothetical protein